MSLAEFAEFLGACIGDDEAVARAALFSNGRWHRAGEFGRATLVVPEFGPVVVPEQVGSIAWDSNGHIARWDPARVLIECTVKRRIVDGALLDVRDARQRPGWTVPDDQIDEKGRAYRRGVENQKAEELPSVLGRTERLFRQLALPFADREGYRREWVPWSADKDGSPSGREEGP